MNISILTILEEFCPKGYHYLKGQAHEEHRINNGILLPLEECALRCKDNSECNSFEHNFFDDHCILNRIAHPNRIKQKEYGFCSKQGKCSSTF